MSASESMGMQLLPQAQLAAGCTCRDPLLGRMELSDSWDGGDAVAAQLSKLLAAGTVNINEAIHVANDKAMN